MSLADATSVKTAASEQSSNRKTSTASSTTTIDADAAKRTAAEALSVDILQDLPSVFDDASPITPKSTKRKASVHEDERPTKLQVLDTLTSPSNVAPVAPMFGRSTISAASLARETPRILPDVTATVFPGFAIDPLLDEPVFEDQLDDDETAEESLRMFINADHQLVSPPLSSEDDCDDKEEIERKKTEFLRSAAAQAWKLQLEESAKVAA
ncbi:hypothetical protein ABW19_dt0208061 [Dactylella cylindrospora]|nr:hypothetical protein ABW19_dt0208061 [Dactylella cylindrospora]